MVPNGPRMIQNYRAAHHPPYPILSDKGAKVAAQYLQVKQLFKFGTPTLFVVDQAGIIRFAHYAGSLIEEPDNRPALDALKNL